MRPPEAISRVITHCDVATYHVWENRDSSKTQRPISSQRTSKRRGESYLSFEYKNSPPSGRTRPWRPKTCRIFHYFLTFFHKNGSHGQTNCVRTDLSPVLETPSFPLKIGACFGSLPWRTAERRVGKVGWYGSKSAIFHKVKVFQNVPRLGKSLFLKNRMCNLIPMYL